MLRDERKGNEKYLFDIRIVTEEKTQDFGTCFQCGEELDENYEIDIFRNRFCNESCLNISLIYREPSIRLKQKDFQRHSPKIDPFSKIK